MSFKESEQSVISKRFVSEAELEDIKRKREEEWELAKQQGRQIEKEEDVVHDGRTLYERLKEQKDKKQEEFEEQLKFKNMIYKGLDKEDAIFLSEVSSQQADFHGRRFDSDNIELKSYRIENMRAEEASKSTTLDSYRSPKVKPSRVESKSNKTAVIIRKRQSDTKKTSEVESKKAKEDVKNHTEDKDLKNNQTTVPSGGEGKPDPVPTCLQGLMVYSDSDNESEDG